MLTSPAVSTATPAAPSSVHGSPRRSTPTVYAVQTYDAAAVLNQALSSATALDGDSLSAALGGLGEIADSPRGPWTFDGQSPRQTMYLRTVENSGDRLVNVVSADLGMQSQV